MEITTAQPKKPQLSVSIEGNILVIKMPIQNPPTLSGSGKSFTLATTNGVKETDISIDGETLMIGVNSYFRNKNYVKQ